MADLSPHERLRQQQLAVAVSSRAEIESFFKETAKEVLMGLARNPHLQERRTAPPARAQGSGA